MHALVDVKLGSGRLQDLELLIQMGALLKKSFNYSSPYKMVSDLNNLKFFNSDEAKLCKKVYLFYFSLQQIIKITVTGQMNENSIDRIDSILRLYNFSESKDNIDRDLVRYSDQIDNLFKMKLCHV